MADVATQVADPSPAPAVEEHYEVPTDPAERAEWRLTGKVSPKKSQPSKDASAPSDKSADGTPSGKGAPVSETGKQTQERPRPNASDRKEELNREIRELLAKRDSLKGEIEGKSKPDVKDSSPAAAPAPSVPSELKAPAKPDYAKLRNDAKTWDEGEAAVESAREKYLEEMADFRAEQKFRNLQADQAKQAATREMQAKLTEATKRYGAEAGSTIQTTVKTIFGDQAIPGVVKAMMDQSSVFVDLAYVIGSKPEEFSQFVELAKSNPGAAIRKLVLTERLVMEELAKGGTAKAAEDGGNADEVPRGSDGKFQSPKTPEKKTTQATEPPEEVSGRSSTPPDELAAAANANDFTRFRNAANARDLAKRRKG
jgi:hypothetical protein